MEKRVRGREGTGADKATDRATGLLGRLIKEDGAKKLRKREMERKKCNKLQVIIQMGALMILLASPGPP